MEKHYTRLFVKGIVLLIPLCFIQNFSFATDSMNPLHLGSAKEFVKSFNKIEPNGKHLYSLQITPSQVISVAISNNVMEANKFHVFGNVVGYEQATFFANGDSKNVTGKVLFRKSKEAYDLYTDKHGDVLVRAIDINEVICVDYNEYKEEPQAEVMPVANNVQKNMETQAAPLLNSLPSASRTLYLDFDGENVTNSNWGNINAAASSFSNANITTIWTCVSEDYSPYNVNVTTDVAVFNSAPNSQRMKVIFTPTNTAAPGAGGVAFLNSWGSGEPCWIFNNSVKSAEEAASHESGHTLGLSHDGTASQEYYAGHATWGPIMGAVYTRAIVHFSKGEYSGANNQQDDLTIISNRIPYRIDDHGNTTSTASPMVMTGSGTVSSSSNYGVIEKRTDLDLFAFTTTGGTVSFTINSKTESGSASVPDLDIQARILDANGTEIIKVDPTGVLTAAVTMSQSLTAGSYYLEIDGVGYGSPLNTGYSDYGSLGQYFISGNVPGGTSGSGINENEISHSINVFPNPSNGVFTINAAMAGSNETTLQISNSLGQTVLLETQNVSGKYQKSVDISTQGSGIYFISLRSGKEVWKGKVILK